MIDVHAHILFDSDDGPETIETSIEMCKMAQNDGVKAIIATPHFIFGEQNEQNVHQKVRKLNKVLKEKHINLEIFPGNEIFMDYLIEEKMASGECCSLNHSKYVLIELPMLEVPKYSSDVFYELQIKGFVPIIAHPERNMHLQSHPELIYKFVEEGCLIQANSSSITGRHGNAIKRTVFMLLKHHLVHFVASDAHSVGSRSPLLSPSKEIVKQILGAEKTDVLYSTNPCKVLHNESICFPEPIPLEKKGRLHKMLRLAKE